jgi:hypothetical protein
MNSVSTADSSSQVSRRTLLRRGGAALATVASAGTSGCITTLLYRRQQRRGPGGPPISFASERQRIRKQDATITVRNRYELLKAINQPNAVIWIPENVTIDMSDDGNNVIAPNVTIASNRNLNGGTGGMIKTNTYTRGVFRAKGRCRVTGIRLKGPRTEYFDPGNTKPEIYAHAATGVLFEGETAIVDNCELFGWTAQGLSLGTKGTQTQGWIHHNDMHHNQMNHLGYPMEIYNGFHLIEWNYFSRYRHAITGYGYATSGYEARFNIVGPPGGAPAGFAFDMHSLGEQPNFPNHVTTAGKYMNIHHNVFELVKHNALSISGQPTKYARFVDNWCATSKGGDGPGVPAVYAPDAAEVHKKHNQFGKGAVLKGRQWVKDLATRISISNGKPSLAAWKPPSVIKQSEKQQSGKKRSGQSRSSPTSSGKNGAQTATTSGGTRSTEGS